MQKSIRNNSPFDGPWTKVGTLIYRLQLLLSDVCCRMVLSWIFSADIPVSVYIMVSVVRELLLCLLKQKKRGSLWVDCWQVVSLCCVVPFVGGNVRIRNEYFHYRTGYIDAYVQYFTDSLLSVSLTAAFFVIAEDDEVLCKPNVWYLEFQ